MRLAFALTSALLGVQAMLDAQSPAPLAVPVQTTAVAAPRALEDVARPDAAWRPAVGDVPLASVVTELRGTRFTATTDETVYRHDAAVTGNAGVAATLEFLKDDEDAVAGLALGPGSGRPALIALVRGDGMVAVRRGAVQDEWRPVGRRTAATGATRLQVRVDGATAIVSADGELVATVQISAGALVGPVGVYVGGGADVRVSALTVDSASAGIPQR